MCRVSSSEEIVSTTAPAPPARSVARALQLLGDHWTLMILRNAFLLGSRRFQHWRDQTGMSESVLAGRLRDLLEAKVLARVEYGEAPARYEYRLTERGLELWSFLVAIWAWERRWGSDRAAVELGLVHLACSATTVPVLICAACGEAVSARGDTHAELVAPGEFVRDAPPRFRRRSSRGAERVPAELLIQDSMVVLGDRWSAYVLGAALLGRRRFVDFQRELGASPAILSDRLRRLTATEVLRNGAPAGARRREYRLTGKGIAMFPMFALLIAWGDRWFPAPGGPPLRICHRACGAPLDPVLACDRCGAWLERREVRFVSGAQRRYG